MKEHLKILGVLTALLYIPAGFAQDDESTLPSGPGTENTNVPAGQEVEINEDNYRQFMELKDARRQRSILAQDAFKSGSGLKKLDDLPEESQKHLRNQLREIIVQGDQWQPGDEGKSYPYVPSTAASTDQALQKLEAEAWGELVDSYHRREAQIYENSARSQAAMASEDNSGGGSSNSNGSPGDGSGQAGSGEQTSQESRSAQSSTAGSYAPGGSNDPNAKSTAGVSQNAMEFLNQIRNRGANAGSGGGESTEGDGGQGEEQAQPPPENSSEQNITVDISPPNPSNDPNAKSTAGSSQNAMEFLQGKGNEGSDAGEDGQGDDQAGLQSGEEQEPTAATEPQSTPVSSSNEADADSTAGDSQNALEYLTGEDRQSGSGQTTSTDPAGTEGTLSIEDLMNAQGVGGVPVISPPENRTDDEQNPGGNPPDKDGGA